MRAVSGPSRPRALLDAAEKHAAHERAHTRRLAEQALHDALTGPDPQLSAESMIIDDVVAGTLAKLSENVDALACGS